VVAEARRRWSGVEKQAIFAEAARPGANISAVADRGLGLKPSPVSTGGLPELQNRSSLKLITG